MPWPTTRRVIGTKVQRLDGPDKATGRARYSFDINLPGMLHARILRCPHAHARIKNIDSGAAEKTNGFRALHIIANAGVQLFFAGAEIVAVAADTEEHADDCLHAIRIDYEVLPHFVKEADALRAPDGPSTVPGGTPNVRPGGDFSTAKFDDVAYEGTAPRVEGTYGVAIISHQCLESHGLVAQWDNDLANLTVYASTQAVPLTAQALAQNFKLPVTRVKCITNYMGGGFGSKFGPDIQGIVAAELARKARAPVKLMLDRAEEVAVGGQRPSAAGTVRIAGTKEGDIRAYEVDCYGSPGVGGGATVNLGFLPYVYSVPNIKRRHRFVRLNLQTGRAMRAPGHPQNCLLTDQAVDDLAASLGLNPIILRTRNLPQNDQNAVQNDPTSFPALRHTIYTRQLEIIRKLCSWDDRWHPPGRGDGVIKTGLGMALHTWGGGGGPPNPTRVTVSSDGSVLVQSSTQDLGTACRTVPAIITADILGLRPQDITVQIGDSTFGPSTPSGGSTTCPGISPAILKAAEAARDALFAAIAPGLNAQAADLSIDTGHVINRANNNARIPWRNACGRLGMNTAIGNGDWPTNAQFQQNPDLRREWRGRLTNNGVGGVQVAEVKVDTETGVVRCTRFWAVQDCGLIINKLACESQVAGGVIMGVNYALFEECIYDRVTGRMLNPDMEFYKLGGIRDMPDIMVHMMDMPERGVIGIGEPPTISTAAAVGNAVFNAIGVRVPQAPFTPERVLAALANGRKRN
ncbi:MAG: xanthine dehydrogenase family protein molybdopterin-binding subunit [Planctomycetes bacterium]|nr:xanthine dehydrogenase family protein molybdopterin-binding subunit [Planctomycetota bacterium]